MLSHNSFSCTSRSLQTIIAQTLIGMSAATLTHSNSGFFSFVIGPEEQVVCNATTGEKVIMKRTAQMQASQKVFDMKFSDNGWGSMLGSESGKVLVRNLGFKKLAKSDGSGKVFIQDPVANRVYYLDDPKDLATCTEKHMEFSDNEKLTFTDYLRDRIVTVTPSACFHIPCGAIYWQIRTLMVLLDLNHITGNDSVNRWVKQNYARAKDFWDKTRKRCGF